jgi:phage regulator Rha-like protein
MISLFWGVKYSLFGGLFMAKDIIPIQNLIYEIRGHKVMLDRDLAELYEVNTKRLNEAVKRNEKRFPPDFMFQLTTKEWEILRSQIATSSWGGTRYLPYAFTEHGVSMLSNVLQSKRAVDVSIQIIRAFIAMRNLLFNQPTYVYEIKELQVDLKQLKQYIEDVFTDYNDINEDTRMQLELINETLAELQSGNQWKPRNPIGFKNNNLK